MVAVAMAIAKTTPNAITVKVIPKYILNASFGSEWLIHRQEQIYIILLLQLHLAFRPFHVHCLFVMLVLSVHHMTHCILPCCMG